MFSIVYQSSNIVHNNDVFSDAKEINRYFFYEKYPEIIICSLFAELFSSIFSFFQLVTKQERAWHA
jgi:hypothetical protein